MRYARIENGVIREIGIFDSIKDRFHPSLVWVECPSNAIEGMRYEGGKFLPPNSPTADEIKNEIISQISTIQFSTFRQLSDIVMGAGDVVSGGDNKTPRQRLTEKRAQMDSLRAKLK